MAAKKNVAVTPAFTGRNVSLSEISQASGIGIATLKLSYDIAPGSMLDNAVMQTMAQSSE